ncbi:hypothetical protein H8B09_29785 [Paenibacillus sp. PR3]|uniref:YunG n=1 Tax=Paenibacillus terricola TaxID=2763503 RepID=A0ABR8N5V8_9BACL|nr:hypothetical protein [Paenibacillus terricola]MBD3922936.1 hypothetical protein [Paenibacillus terricola]
MQNILDKKALLEILLDSWSLRSSSKWTLNNPARGQCGVTALVIHDLIGGRIVKTHIGEGWHFYNDIDNQRYDFTESQFSKTIIYEDLLSNREEALLDTNQEQYEYLHQRVIEQLKMRQRIDERKSDPSE